MTSNWYQKAIFYEINVRTFYDSNNDGIGDFSGIAQKLDYIRDLGVDCIWLQPIYQSPLLDGGYDISDFYNIHPDLGTLKDLQTLIKKIHAKGMRIILDLVVNHTSDQCVWFKEARSDPKSPYRDYYVWSDTDKKYSDARIIFIDTEDSNWTWDEQAGQFYWHRFYASQPDLNYDNIAVRDEMKSIMRYWLDMGIDGFRADAVPYLIEREGTSCENLPETHSYLKEIRALIDMEYPECILLAEANQWPKDLIPYFAEGDEVHMAFHFPIMPRIFKSVALGSSLSLIDTLKNTPPIPESCQWCTFLRNHDELTLEMVSEEDRQLLWRLYAPEKRMRLNLGIRRRLAPLMDGDLTKIELLYALLFALPGTPILYYGDEIGMGDKIRLNDRDGVRTPMQWSDDFNAGFSRKETDELILPVIDKDFYSYHKVNVAAQLNDNASLLNRIKRLIATRKAHPVFSSHTYEIENIGLESVFSIRRADERESVLCLHNLSSDSQAIPLEPGKYHLLESSHDSERKHKTIEDEIILPPYTYAWLIAA